MGEVMKEVINPGDKVRITANRSDHRGKVGEQHHFIRYGTKLEHDHIVVIGDNGFLTNFSLFLSEIEKVDEVKTEGL